MARRNFRLTRYARTITVDDDKVRTRLSKREYEFRRDAFDDPDFGDSRHDHLRGHDYDQWTEWGGQGGRPKKWKDEATRKRFTRAQNRLAKGQSLTQKQKELLGLIKKRPGAYKSDLGRRMNPKERQRKRRAKLKGGSSV